MSERILFASSGSVIVPQKNLCRAIHYPRRWYYHNYCSCICISIPCSTPSFKNIVSNISYISLWKKLLSLASSRYKATSIYSDWLPTSYCLEVSCKPIQYFETVFRFDMHWKGHRYSVALCVWALRNNTCSSSIFCFNSDFLISFTAISQTIFHHSATACLSIQEQDLALSCSL